MMLIYNCRLMTDLISSSYYNDSIVLASRWWYTKRNNVMMKRWFNSHDTWYVSIINEWWCTDNPTLWCVTDDAYTYTLWDEVQSFPNAMLFFLTFCTHPALPQYRCRNLTISHRTPNNATGTTLRVDVLRFGRCLMFG